MNKMTTDATASGGTFRSENYGQDKWAAIWFERLCCFTQVPLDNDWNFSAEQVIAFLRHRISRRDPAWKRLRIIQGLRLHRRKYPVARAPELKFIETKLEEITATERVLQDCGIAPKNSTKNGSSRSENSCDRTEREGDSDSTRQEAMIDVVGKINSREPDVVQQMRRKLRLMGREWNTEKAYVKWVKRFLISRGVSAIEHFASVKQSDVETFLTDLVVDGNVAASTQDQAFYALLFLFEHVLDRDIGNIEAMRSAKPKLRPTVMSDGEVRSVLGQMRGRYLLVAQLLYGCGIRISEALRLRVKDIDFDQRQIHIYCSKGKKSRLVPLPKTVVTSLTALIDDRRRLHAIDESNGMASVWLPFALDRKFVNAHREFKWQFLFASQRHAKNPKTGRFHRHHIRRDSFSKVLSQAVRRADILKYVTAHTFRHSFATSLLRSGTDIRVVQELLGHADVATTMIYTHVLMDEKMPVVSPLDFEER